MSIANIDNELLNFSEQINRYGHAITISATKGGLHTNIQSSFIPINELTNGTSFYLYLKELLNNFNVDQLVVVAKQRNGINAYKNPRTFVFDIPVESPIQTHTYPRQVGAGLTGLSNVHTSNADPMVQVYQFQITQLNKEVGELKPFKEKYEDEREKRFDLERELKLIQEKHDLEKAKEEYANKNSVSGVLKEMQPALTQALAGFAGMQNAEPNALGSAPVGNPKINFVAELLSEMEEAQTNDLVEIIARLAFTSNAIKQVLSSIQKKTTHLDTQIEEIKNQYN